MFWKIGYNVITFVQGVTNIALSCDSNCDVHVVKVWYLVAFLWEKLPYPQLYKDLTIRIKFFEVSSWLKLNNSGLALDWHWLLSVTPACKRVKTKGQKFLSVRNSSQVCRSYRRILVGVFFAPSPTILKRVKYEFTRGLLVKLKTLYLHYHSAYGQKTCQGGDILQGSPKQKFAWPLIEVFMWDQVTN